MYYVYGNSWIYSLEPEPEPGGQSGISDGGATRNPRREHALARLPERLLRALVHPEAAGVFSTQRLSRLQRALVHPEGAGVFLTPRFPLLSSSGRGLWQLS